MNEVGAAALTLVVCLAQLTGVQGEGGNAEQNNPPNCSFRPKDIKQQCYNPLWCEGVLSARECSDKSQCCKHVHRKVECLSDMINEQSKACAGFNLSMLTLETLSKNLSTVESQVADLHTKLSTLSATCSINGNIALEIKTQKDSIDTISSRLDSVDGKSKEVESDFNYVRAELSELKQNKFNIEEQMDNLKNDPDLVNEKIKSSDLTSEKEAQKDRTTKTNTKLETLEQTSEQLQAKFDNIKAELDELKQGKTDADGVLNSLKDEIKKTSNSLSSLDLTVKNEQTQREARMSDVNDQLTKNIASSENKLQVLVKKENENTDRKLKTLDNKCTGFENELTTSLSLFNTSFEQYRTEATRNLQRVSTDHKDDIKSIDMRIQTLDNSIHIVKTTLDDDIKKKTDNVLQKSIETVKEKSSEINKRMDELSTNIDKKTESIKTEIEALSKVLAKSEKDLQDQVEIETKKLNNDIERRAKDLNVTLSAMSSRTDSDISKTNTKLTTLEHDISRYKAECESQVADTESTLTKLIDDKVAAVQSNLDESIEIVKKEIESLKTEIGTRIKKEVDQLALQTKAVNQTVTKQKEMVDIIYPNTFNKEMFTMAFLVLVVLMAINYIIVYILVKRTSPSSAYMTNQTPGAQMAEEPHSPVEVCNRLNFPKSLPHKLSEPLNNSVGVISFYEDSQKHHKRLMRTIREHIPERQLPGVDVEYHVVRRHEHIPGIPRSKLCIMFVEFSERHVIIEEPGLGLGDLKRKTAEHITKLGACLVIVYVKDPVSRNLKASELFNSSIHCTKSQPELIALAKTGRFLSIYDKFTASQIERLVDIVTSNLRHTGKKIFNSSCNSP